MNKRILSVILTIMMLATMCWTGVSAAGADDYSAVTLDPIYSADNVAVGTSPVAITENAVSDFTADVDYTVKSGESASVTFDMPDSDWKNIYFNDFNNGEVWTSSAERNNMSNTGTALKFVGKIIDKSAWFAADPIVTDIGDFELEFDVVSVGHSWTNANFYMHKDPNTSDIGQYVMYICGSSAAPTIDGEKAYLYFQNRATGEKLGYNGTVAGKTVRVVSIGKTVQIYVNDVLAIDYVCGYDWFKPATGSIYATVTECAITYDNVSVNVPHDGTYDPETDSYYEVGLGENVTLGRRVNGVYTEISKSDITLTADKQYNFKVMRAAGSVTITADGEAVLNTAIDFPYTEGDVSLWNGLIGVTASGNDTVDRIAVYDSTNLNFTDEYVEIVPFEDAVKDEFTLSGEGTWDTNGLKGDSSYSITSDSEFSVSSDSRTNSWVYARDLLNNTHSDVYISFDIKTNRDSHTNDRIYFAGYTLAFSVGNIPTATNASGTSITVNDSYKYYGTSYYTVELIKKGSAVSVYYYPAGAERNLLFTDNSCTETATNFGIYKFQGTLSFKNFTVYDAVPSDVKKFIALSANSLYVKTADGVGAVPMGTTVREVKANLINASTVNITRDGVVLTDTDTVLSGDVIESTEIATLKWNIGTLGDLNGDGVIDNADLELAGTVSGAASAQTAALAGADINQDGTVDESDITELSRMIAENDTAMTYIKRSIVGDALLLHGKNIGRQYYEENVGVNFEWTAANITIGGYMQGDVTVTINFDSGSEIDESAVDIFIDGDTKTRNFMHLSLGTHTYTIAEDLEPGYHTVQIMKNNESIMGAFYMEAIGLTGTPEKVADKDRKIEFLGDSITAGCGVLLTNDSDWYHYNYHTYASVAARALNADYYAMANSGWGFARNLKNPSTLNRIYDLATDRRDPKLTYDFSWKPDLVVVNLGTNDNTVLNNQRKAVEEDDDDTTVYDYTAAEEKYKSEVVAMLDRIRTYNADAKIIWTYGAMGYGMTGPDGRTTGDWIKEAVEEYNTTDGKVMFYRMPASMNGGGGHPDSIGSKYLGEEFAEVIAEYMEWDYTPEIPATYEYGETVSSYDFEDGTTQGIIANNLSLAYNSNNRLMLQSQDNLSVLSSAFAGNKYLDTYEMTLNWDHEGATEWNRMILTLRSPNSSLTDAIYLTVLGTNLAVVDNYYNPLKYTTNNVQLIASKGGVMTELGSLQMDDILNGKNKNINVKMGIDWLEVTIWDADAEKPATPTFAVPINDDIAPAYGDIFAQGRNSNDVYDNINIVYGVNVDLPGDLDRSAELDAPDLALMRQYLLNIDNDIDRFATDVNLDSKINLLDLIRLKKNMVK